MKKHNKYDEASCDWNYNASCCADTDCFDSCDMPCPYDKKINPCEMCEIDIKECKDCRASIIYLKRMEGF